MLRINPRSFTFLSMVFMILNAVQILAQNTPYGNSDESIRRQASDLLSQVNEFKAGPAIIAVIAIVVGFVVTFFGYKLIKPALYVCGFMIGSYLAYVVVYRIFRNKDYVVTAAWIAFVIGGLLIGALAFWMLQLGTFAVGVTAGVLLGFTLHNTIGYRIWPSNPNAMLWILVIIFGLLLGCLTLRLQKPMLIVATSIFGAIACIWGIGYFAGRYPNGADLKYWRRQVANGNWEYNVPSEWWYYLAATIVMCLLGIFVQMKYTAIGLHHDHLHTHHRRHRKSYSVARTHAEEGPNETVATPSVAAKGNPIAHV